MRDLYCFVWSSVEALLKFDFDFFITIIFPRALKLPTPLKGLSHEKDFKNFDKKLHNLA
jgi:hypothetical protein